MAAAMVVVVFGVLLSQPASAASITSVVASNPAPGSVTSLDLNLSGYQTSAAVRCLAVDFTGGYVANQNHYGFDTDVSGWTTAAGTASFSNSITHSPATGSLAVTNNWSTSTVAFLGDNRGSIRDLSAFGDTFSAWAWVPAGTTGSFAAAIQIQDSAYSYQSGGYFYLAPGRWTQITYTPPAALPTSMRSIAINLTATGAANGSTIYFDDVTQGSGASSSAASGKPQGLNAQTSSVAGTYVSGTWTRDATAEADGTIVFNNSTGSTPTGSSSVLRLTNITQPVRAAGTVVFTRVTTYSATGSNGVCGGTVLDASFYGAYNTTPGTVVSASVLPSFTFTVTGSSAACNGLTNANGTNATAIAVPLGNIATGTRGSGAQSLTVGTNAANGFTVKVRSASATAPVMTGQANSTYRIADVTAGPLPSVTTEAFGFTTDDTGVAMTGGNVAPVPISTGGSNVITANTGVQNRVSCVGYFASITAATKADTYATTVVYTAVPSF